MKLPRMWDWILMTLVCMAAVHYVAPQQTAVVLYKFSLVALSACTTIWIDKSLFARLSDGLIDSDRRDTFSSARVISRAMIFLAIMLGVALGV